MINRPSLLWCCVVAGMGTWASADAQPSKTPAARGVEFLRVPNGGLQPQTVVDAQGVIHLIYLQGEPAAADVYYVRRAATDTAWSSPLRVNSQPGSAVAMGTVRGAKLALGRNGRVHVAWNGSAKATPRASGKYSSPLLYASLNDSGEAVEPQRNLMTVGTSLDGGGSLAADADGRVYVIWHAAAEEGAGEAKRRVWLTTSTDDGLTFPQESAIDVARAGVCGCCGLDAFADASGTLRVFYRSAREGTHRDMHLLTSTDHGKTFQDILVSEWLAVQCPMSTAALTEAAGTTYAAWEADGQVSYAPLNAKTGMLDAVTAAPGTGAGRKHPRLAINSAGHVLLVWAEGTGWQRGGQLAWQEYDANGRRTSTKGREPGIVPWSFAIPIALPDGRFAIVY